MTTSAVCRTVNTTKCTSELHIRGQNSLHRDVCECERYNQESRLLMPCQCQVRPETIVSERIYKNPQIIAVINFTKTNFNERKNMTKTHLFIYNFPFSYNFFFILLTFVNVVPLSHTGVSI